jgi:hypothetical protein
MVLAGHNFQSAKGFLPPYSWSNYNYTYTWSGNSLTGVNSSGTMNTGYLAEILPYIEQNMLYANVLTSGGAVNCYNGYSYPVKTFINPTDPTSSPDGLINGSGITGFAVNATALPSMYAYSYNYGGYSGLSNYNYSSGQKVTLEASFPDGTSNTVLLTEKYSQCSYYTNIWAYVGSYPYFYNTYTIQAQPTPSACNMFGSVQTGKASGILCGLADGSVRNVSNAISATTWQHALTPNDGVPLGSDW